MNPEISIIIPAYNEENRITPTLIDLDHFLKNKGWCYEVVVVDDGSIDNTSALIKKLAEQLDHLRLITLPENRGKGHAVQKGMLEASGNIRVMFDADGYVSPEQ